MARRRPLFVSFVVLALVVGPAYGSDSKSPSNAAIKGATDLRAKLGFDASPGYVLELEADPAALRPLGIAMTPAEVEEVDRRVALAERVGDLSDRLSTISGYAGIWFDQQGGGKIVVMTSSLPAPMTDATLAFGLVADEFTVKQVANPLADLEATFDAVNRDSQLLAAEGVQLSSIDLDEVRNVVRLGVIALTPAISAALTERYGDSVLAEQEEPAHTVACTSRANCANPDKGGLLITATVGGTPHNCTSGFLGRPLASSTPLYIITAGHCLQEVGLAATWKHNGVALGTGVGEDYYDNSSADSGWFSDVETAGKNFFYASSSSDIRAVTGKYTNAQQVVGFIICRGGWTSGYDCGTVEFTNITAEVTDDFLGVTYTIFHMWVTDFPSAAGDSGSPIFYTTRAAGIASATTPTYTLYSTIDWIGTESGVRPCYSSACA